MINIARAVAEAVAAARGYCCDSRHDDGGYRFAPGTPPEKFFERIGDLLGEHGYGLRYETRAYLNDGDATVDLSQNGGKTVNGTTVSPMADKDPSTVLIADDLNPARAFAVLVHEAAHVVLNHSVTTEEEDSAERLKRMFAFLFSGGRYAENPEDEIAAELATMAVVSAAGMPVSDISLCYLAGRFAVFGWPDPANERGREILKQVMYAAALLARTLLPGEDMVMV